MSDRLSPCCLNCGTPLDHSSPDAKALVCPVCHFVNQLQPTPASHTLTSDALEAQLELLIGKARTGGLELDEIVRILRDELEFTAELASNGRNLPVQIIDLGPLEAQGMQTPSPQRMGKTMLRGRAVGS
jgi:hypothetical protein